MQSDETEIQPLHKFQYGRVILISAAHGLHDIYSSFLAPVLPLLIAKFGISYSLAGFLSVVQRLPGLANPFIGLLADRISLRYFVIFAPSVTAIVMCLLGVAPSYIVIVILLTIMGISSSLFHVTLPIMIKKVSGNRTGMGMSFYMLGAEIARTMGPLTILGAISLWGFEGTYRLIPFALVASGFLYFKLRKISIREEFAPQDRKTGKRQTLRKHTRFFLLITGFFFLSLPIKSAITFYLPTYIETRGESLYVGGMALALFQLAGAIGTFVGGTISDKIGRHRTMLAATITAPILMFLFSIIRNPLATGILLVLLGFSVFASSPVLHSVVYSVKTDRPAFISGIYSTLSFLIGSLTVLLVGTIADFTSLHSAFLLCPIFGILAIPFAALITKF